jgi:peptidoglycan/LPS O-acetylase OafA/YrhL
MTDVSTGIITYLILLIPNLLFMDPYDAIFTCGSHEVKEWGLGAVVTLSFLLLIGSLMLAGTIVDILDQRTHKHRAQDTAFNLSQRNAKPAASSSYVPPPLNFDDGSAIMKYDDDDPMLLGAQQRTPTSPMRIGAGVAYSPNVAGMGSLNGPSAAPQNAYSQNAVPIPIPAARRLRMKSAQPSSPGGMPDSYSSSVGATGSLLRVDSMSYMNRPAGMLPAADESMLGRSPQGILLTSVRRPLSANNADDSAPAVASLRYPMPPALPEQRFLGQNSTPVQFPSEPSVTAESKGLDDVSSPYELLAGNTFKAFLKCFSIVANATHLFEVTGRRKIGTSSIDGLRVISMGWIMLGHTLMFMAWVGFVNADAVLPPSGAFSQWSFQVVPSSEFAVDTFLVMGGFLAALYMILFSRKQNPARLTVLQVAAFIAHRIGRLVPTLAAVLAFFMFIFPLLSSGPFWMFSSTTASNCNAYWWANLMFVNNLVPAVSNFTSECMGWTFYLALDMQLFLTVPLLIFTYLALPVAGVVLTALHILVCLISAGVLVTKYNMTSLISFGLPIDFAYNDNYYSKPWTRAPPYYVGVLVAFAWDQIRLARKRQTAASQMPVNMLGIETYAAMHMVDRRPRTPPCSMSAASQTMVCFLAMGVCSAIVYAPAGAYQQPTNEWDPSTNLAYTVLSRTAWATGVGMILLMCVSQSNNALNQFLGYFVWQPFAKLTYSVYLLHPMVIQWFQFSQTQYVRFATVNLVMMFAAVFALSFCIAVLLYLAVERPFANMERLWSDRASTLVAKARRSLLSRTEIDSADGHASGVGGSLVRSLVSSSRLTKGHAISVPREDGIPLLNPL